MMFNWRDAKKTPPIGPCLVILAEEMHGTRIHGAMFHPNLGTIGGLFSFDCPEVMYWVPEGEVQIPED